MTTLFISDLHLDGVRPQVTDLFLRFLREDAASADALYILGDLFESWVGDDDPQPAADPVAQGLRAIAAAGVPIYFMRGNRDFLLGDDYAARAGATVLPDPCVAMLYGEPTLLMHGDLLCTDDHAYQAFRVQSRDPDFQCGFLARPLEQRLAIAQQARAASQAHQRTLAEQRGQSLAAGATREDITDVAPAAVEATLARYGTRRLIHGHTHRPAIHALDVAGSPRSRVVLGDWYTQGSVLRVKSDGMTLTTL